MAAAKRFLRKVLEHHGRPDRIVIDASQTNREAIVACDGENRLQDRSRRPLKPIRIRQSQYQNNRTEQDYRSIKGSLSFSDMDFVNTKPISARLGFAIQLKFFASHGFFMMGCSEALDEAVSYLAEQLGADRCIIVSYDFAGRTGRPHCAEILQYLGFRRMKRADRAQLANWVAAELCPAYFPRVVRNDWSFMVVIPGFRYLKGPHAMCKLILQMQVSLDGYVGRAGNGPKSGTGDQSVPVVGWLLPSSSLKAFCVLPPHRSSRRSPKAGQRPRGHRSRGRWASRLAAIWPTVGRNQRYLSPLSFCPRCRLTDRRLHHIAAADR